MIIVNDRNIYSICNRKFFTDSSQHQNGYREFFGVRVEGRYAPTLTEEEKIQMEYNTLSGLYQGCVRVVNVILEQIQAMSSYMHHN